ncbi:hypothetical protein GWI33_000626 [Rhynchophorus ferrugineus]|uniref:Uncharacterized protein n=1 Tax=Rhynchophorus ferrugineus TaxID=354439 RepID=A0A834MH76_RHYFE|nr:hypothetical protein GWI33_000626 [Rhynchophorus ferrugineus]
MAKASGALSSTTKEESVTQNVKNRPQERTLAAPDGKGLGCIFFSTQDSTNLCQGTKSMKNRPQERTLAAPDGKGLWCTFFATQSKTSLCQGWTLATPDNPSMIFVPT